MTKDQNRKVNSKKLNNFSSNASFEPILHMQASLDPQNPSLAHAWNSLPQMHVNAGGWGCERVKDGN